jgi:hypothetical protein
VNRIFSQGRIRERRRRKKGGMKPKVKKEARIQKPEYRSQNSEEKEPEFRRLSLLPSDFFLLTSNFIFSLWH